jgi:hypothetical protein
MKHPQKTQTTKLAIGAALILLAGSAVYFGVTNLKKEPLPELKPNAYYYPAPTRSKNSKRIFFLNRSIAISYDAMMDPEKNGEDEYTVYQDPHQKIFVHVYKNTNDFFRLWSISSVDSDGVNAGQGRTMLPEVENIHGNAYQRYVSYYNPIQVTKSGVYNPKISSITSTHCVNFSPHGAVILVSPVMGPEGADACVFVKEHAMTIVEY